MNSPAVDIATILQTAGVGTIGTDLFVSGQPADPNACVTVIDTGGFPPESNYRYDYPTVQVLIRGVKNTYITTYAVAESVKTTLNGYANTEVDSEVTMVGVWAMGDIMALGTDERERPLFSVNFRMQRQT